MTYHRLKQLLTSERPLVDPDDEEMRQLLLTLGSLAYRVGYDEGALSVSRRKRV
jgi:hypothetical protein